MSEVSTPRWSAVVRRFEPRTDCSVFTYKGKGGRKLKGARHCQGKPLEWVFFSNAQGRAAWEVLCEEHRSQLSESEGWGAGAWALPAPTSAEGLFAVLDMLWRERWADDGFIPRHFIDTADFKGRIAWAYGTEEYTRLTRAPGEGHTHTMEVSAMPRTEIYKHGEDVSVVTTAADERDFIETFSEALRPLMQNGSAEREAREAVRAGFDIVAKLRGYKSDVQERRVLAAGRWPHPSETPLAGAGNDGETED